MWNQKPREQRILERIQSIKKKTKKVIVKRPKRDLNSDKEVKELLSILDSKEKATIKLDKVLKRLK